MHALKADDDDNYNKVMKGPHCFLLMVAICQKASATVQVIFLGHCTTGR